MSCEINQDPQLMLITGLCRELVKFGLNVGLSDAKPAAVVRTSDAPELWITVDESAEFFEWTEAKSQHPATDPTGVAALISEHVKAQRSRAE